MTPNNQYKQDMEICRAATDILNHRELLYDCVSYPIGHSDIEFIAHFNPQRVIQILERQRELEKCLQLVAGYLDLEDSHERYAFGQVKEILSNE